MSCLCCLGRKHTETPKVSASEKEKTQSQPDTNIALKDQDFLSQQWKRAVNRRKDRLDAETAEMLLQLSDKDDLQSCITFLDHEYRDQGVAAGIQPLESTLASINSFSEALSNIAQAGPEPGQAIWGSFLLLIKLTLRHQGVLDKVTQMLDDLTSAMPRFDSYLDLYPTPQLKRAMYAIYSDFIEFTLSSAEFLSHSAVGNIFRLSWSSIDGKFEKIKQQLQMHKESFEAEAQLATVQANKKWQDAINEKLSIGSSSQTTGRSNARRPSRGVSTLPFPRNLMFTGREDIFNQIRDSLQAPSDDVQSVALFGIGGVGKTQIALEYAYRQRSIYPYLIWIKSETEVELRQSLVQLVRALSLSGAGETEQKDVVLAQRWLDDCPDRWLLIFDNVQRISTIKHYWPHNPLGNVIVTSQKPISEGLTKRSIPIKPFTVEEGSTLILRQMHLNETARSQAEELCNELGGAPLAISHYVGFCVASHLSLQEVLSTFQQRSMAAEIWSCDSNMSILQYEKTLNTVWDAALDDLNENARELLDILAFLNPDYISEDFLRGNAGADGAMSSSFGLTVILSNLTRRNLIERNVITTGHSIRMHRSLRLALLLKLDEQPEKRHEAFHKAVLLARNALPHRDMTTRNPRSDQLWEKYMPQVLSLQLTFERSDPPIEAEMEFPSLLADAGSFLWQHQLNRIAVPLLTLGKKIVLENLQDSNNFNPILASIETFLGFADAHESTEGRRQALQGLQRVVKLREQILDSLQPNTATIEQQVDLGRAWNDLAYMYADLEEFDEADRGMSKALTLYQSLGDETTLRFRFALQYADLTVVRFGQGRLDEALDFGRRSYELCKAELGHEHLETVRFEAQWAYALIGVGDLNAALERLTDVLEVRLRQLEADNPDVLNTKYWIGTVHYYLDQLDEAESFLRETTAFSTDSGFGKPDLARAQYRLALILYDQRRRKDAAILEAAALASVAEDEWPPGLDPDSRSPASRDKVMVLLDKRVYVQNGRSTGAFRGWRGGKV